MYQLKEERILSTSPGFMALYAGDIAQHTRQDEAAMPGDFGEWDNTTKCAVLPIVLDYLFTGQSEKARSELLCLYPYPDVNDFWTTILETVQVSPLYQ